MKKIFLFIMTVTVTALLATSCGGKGSKETAAAPATVEEQNTQLAEALSAGNVKAASAMADSMSLFVDDFTPEQTVQVLMTFLTVHNEAAAAKDRRRDLETLRKYVDVYDIALSVNPKDTRAAFEKARRINPAVDFDSLATSFREKLTQYDAIHDGSLVTDDPAPADSTANDTATVTHNSENPADLPLELRPAE